VWAGLTGVILPVAISTSFQRKARLTQIPATGISRKGRALFLTGRLSKPPRAGGLRRVRAPGDFGGRIDSARVQPLRMKAGSPFSAGRTGRRRGACREDGANHWMA